VPFIATNNEPRTPDAVLHMKLVGANLQAKVSGLEELPGKSNYFMGNDPKKWRTNVPNYAKVKYADVYPGVDLVYYGNQGKLEYDFVVSPGADPGRITLELQTGQSKIDKHGDLVVATDGGEVVFHKPVIYQPATYNEPRTKNEELIDGRYILAGNRVTFEIANYDRTRPLVIDPVLAYSTYLGGSGSDVGHGIAVDALGNAYVAGWTSSSDFPTTSGAYQTACCGAFVSKLNPAGSALIYSTYLSGISPGVDSQVATLAVDASGDAYVTGEASSGFPTTPGVFQTTCAGGCAFVSKLNPTGSALVYSTYLGGSGYDEGHAITVDASGSAYVTGITRSSDFPTTPGAFQVTPGGGWDAFVSKLNAAGSALIYSTYLGTSNEDYGNGITVDASGNAYVTGETYSSDFPTTPGSFQTTSGGGLGDGFVTKLNAAGSALVYSTYLGGSGDDGAATIVVDTSGNAYVTGATASPDFPTTPGAFQSTYKNSCAAPGAVLAECSSAFVSKLNATGSALLYSTYLGGSGADYGHGIAVDTLGNAYVTGWTFSTDFPTTPDAFQTTFAGGGYYDAFVSKLNAAGSALLHSTLLGGSEGDLQGSLGQAAQRGNDIVIDNFGSVYVVGYTSVADFPTTPGALQTTYGGGYSDAFVSKFSFTTGGTTVTLAPASVTFPVLRTVGTTSLAQTVKLTNGGSGELDVSGITLTGADPGDFAQSNNCIPTAAGGGSCLITVTFTPTAQGVRTASLSIADNAAGSPQTVALTGRGTFLYWAPRDMYMGEEPVGTSSPAYTVKLSNAGTGPISIYSIGIAGVNPGDFTQTNTCGSSLNPGATCAIEVTFTPTAVGPRLGHVAIQDSAFGGTHWVGLLGQGE
jgi:hypothetical protein